MNINKVLLVVTALLWTAAMQAQDKIVYPEITYAGTPRTVTIGGINVSGVDNYEDYVLTGISGLTVGQEIDIPGSQITDAVKRYWKHGLFSKVKIYADSLIADKIYLHIYLQVRPRVSTINYIGLKKSEREDMETKLGLLKGMQVTPNSIDRAKILAKKYFDEKGYKNAEIDINQREDVTGKNQVILDVVVDKKEKLKVRKIYIEGNHQLKTKVIKGGLFKKGAFAKTHEAGTLSSFLKAKKFTPERWEADKKRLIEKYNEYGFRDAEIISDSVWNHDDKHVSIRIKVNEGKKYYLRNISWVGNTVYTTDYLSRVLGMNKGDVYNQKLLNKRLTEDEDAVGNNYWNTGYLFYNLVPAEVNVVGDSIDLEMRIQEGPQAHINHVRINGNDRLYENVVRRELRTKPGDLFSKDALQRSQRELASMGHFEPEKVLPDVQPNVEDGTVDINWNLEQKSNDQIEFSLGWGQTGVIGRIGLKLNNFSMRNLFNKNREHRGILPVGDGEVLQLGAQTNGTYYQSYNASYSTNWFGGKRPIQLSVGAFFSKQTDVSSTYYNSAAMNNYYNYLYGYGSSYYNNLANNYQSATYSQEQQEKYRWVEYHKWKFKAKTYSALTNGQKCLVLMTRVEMGLLGSYNKYKKSPFETYYMGGDGMSGYSSGYAEETVGLRGYENGSLAYNGYAYDRFTMELRYPFMLGNTTIYGLGFAEAGNAWTDTKKFNPFDMKRSAGIGVRIFLPMVGLMGIDWAYGFDNDNINGQKGGSNFHFILGQEF